MESFILRCENPKCSYEASDNSILNFSAIYKKYQCPKCQTTMGYFKSERADDKQIGGDHYKKHKITPWMIIEEYELNFFEGSLLKYLLRHKDKNGLEDLRKMKHYAEKLLELEEAKNVAK